MQLGGRRSVGGALLLAVALAGSSCGARLGSAALKAARARAGGVVVGTETSGGVVPGAAGASGGSATGSAAGSATAGPTGSSGGAGAGGGGGTAGSSSGTGPSVTAGVGASATPGGFAAGPGGVNPFAGPPSGGNGGATDTGVTAATIDLGNVSTQGGPVPGLFAGAYYGALAYVSYINSLGGIYGRRLKVDTADDQLQASTNKAETDQLLSKVLGFLGSFSLETSAGSPDIQAAGAPNVSYAIDQTTQSQSTNFSPQPLGRGWDTGMFIYFGDKFGAAMKTHAAYFIEDNPTAIAAAAQQEGTLTHLGYSIVYSRKVEATETNFQGDVRNMQQKGVKSLFFEGEVSTLARLAAAMHDAGFTVQFPNWGAPAYDPGFVQLSNGGAEGAILTQDVAMYAGEDGQSVPEVALFDTWLKRVAPGQTPDLYAALSWAAGNLLTQALIKAGPHVTRKDVLAALSTVRTFTDNGMVATADPAGKVSPTCWIAIDVKGGRFVRDPVDPPSGFVCNPGGYYTP